MREGSDFQWIKTDRPDTYRIVNPKKGPRVGDTFVRLLPPDVDLDDDSDDEDDDGDDDPDVEQPRLPVGSAAMTPLEPVDDQNAALR